MLRNATIADGRAWFTLTGNGTVGTTEAGITNTAIKPFADGWYLVSITYIGTAAAHTLSICGATADNDATYDDGTNATVDFTLWTSSAGVSTGNALIGTRATSATLDALQGVIGWDATSNITAASGTGTVEARANTIIPYDNLGVLKWGGGWGASLLANLVTAGNDSISDRTWCNVGTVLYGDVVDVMDGTTHANRCTYNGVDQINYADSTYQTTGAVGVATPTSVGLVGQNPGIATEMRIWVGTQVTPAQEP